MDAESSYFIVLMPNVRLRSICFALLVCIGLAVLAQPGLAQESYLVSTSDGVVSMYDLATNTFVTSTKLSGNSFNMVPAANPRLAFVSVLTSYYAVVDTTLNREVARINGVQASSGTISPDGSTFLAPDFSLFLNVIDAAQLKLTRRVSFRAIQPTQTAPGQIVAAGNHAYIFPRTNPGPIAVVDLATYAVSAIPLPAGSVCRKCGAITPDGSTLVVIERENSDGKVHVVLVSTATSTVIADKVQTVYGVIALSVTPNGSDPSKIYGYVAGDLSQGNLGVLDLVKSSPTYGMILLATETSTDIQTTEMALNSEGSRLVIAGYSLYYPHNNVGVYDTAKLLSDPANARIAQFTVGSGTQVTAVCVGVFSTTIPNTAPAVSGVSGDINNDAPHDIQIMGANFQSGALVRIGSMDRLPATVNGSTSLTVTVPAAAPAGRAIDIVVTNPEANAPPDQQNQSGLLAGKFNVLPDPKFQPQTQFTTVNADNSFSVYDSVQRTMVNNQSANLGDLFYYPVFNVDGRELYISQEHWTWTSDGNCCEVLPVDLSNDNVEASIPIPLSQSISQHQGLAAGLNPSNGKPVIDTEWTDNNDLHVSLIDSGSGSPTYHTIIKTFDAGLTGPLWADAMTVSPDGKFAYLLYDNGSIWSLGVMNLATGAFTTFTCDALGVYWNQKQIYIAPDGKSLLLMSYKGNRARVKIFDLYDPMHPRAMLELTPIPVGGRGFPYVANYQVVGDQLYAIDSSGIVVVFNFNRSTGDFRERGYYVLDPASVISGFTFSADGAYLYLSNNLSDQISVMDTSKLVTGKGALVTTLRAPYAPEAMAVSPVPPPSRQATLAHRGNSNGGRAPIAIH